MNDLGGALRELAAHAAAPGVADPEGLWRQGRTRARRRQFIVGVAAAFVIAVFVAMGTYAVVPKTAVSPSEHLHDPAIPKNLWNAPGWLPSTSDSGPLGTAAAMSITDGRRFLVSARTGEYRLLDLPGYDDFDGGHEAQLSPDGNHIAYWYVTGKSRRAYSPTGLAIYDTRSGSVTHWPQRAPKGFYFQPPTPQSIFWLDAETIAFNGGNMPAQGQPGRGTDDGFVGRVGEAEPTKFPGYLPSFGNVGAANRSGRLLAIIDDRRSGFVSASGRIDQASAIKLPKSDADSDLVRLSRDGSYLVGGSFSTRALVTGRVDAAGDVPRMTPIGSVPDGLVLGWITQNQVLVLGTNPETEQHGLYRLDLAKDHASRLGSAEGAGPGVDNDFVNPGGAPYLQVATDLVDQPMVDGVHPPSFDPRLRFGVLVGGGAGLLLLAAGSMMRRRRRV